MAATAALRLDHYAKARGRIIMQKPAADSDEPPSPCIHAELCRSGF